MSSSCVRRNFFRCGITITLSLVIVAFCLLGSPTSPLLNALLQNSSRSLQLLEKESFDRSAPHTEKGQARISISQDPAARTRLMDAEVSNITEDDCKNFIRRLARPAGQVCKNGPFLLPGRTMEPNLTSPHRVAFVIRGEVFRRNSGMYDRDITATPATIKCQLEASASHVKYLIRPMEMCGAIVDVFIVSWEPDGKDSATAKQALNDTYHPRVVWAEYRNHKESLKPKVNGQYLNYQGALESVSSYYNQTSTRYDGMLLVRADLVMKRPLVNLPRVKWFNVLYMFHEWEMGGGYPSGTIQQRLPETMFWYPWKFLNCVHRLGWKEHDSAWLHTLVGFKPLNFMMPDEFHDANSQADWNPLYTQACREPQKFDIHGGPAYAFFNVVPIPTSASATRLGTSFAKSISLQGNPRVIPPSTLVMHSWTQSKTVGDTLKLAFGQTPQNLRHEQASPNWQTSEWRMGLQSLRRSFELLSQCPEFLYRRGQYPGYRYDYICFMRLDHRWNPEPFPLYDHNASEAVFVGFGGSGPDSSSFPVLIVMSHQRAWKFGQYLQQGSWNSTATLSLVESGQRGVMAWLENVTRMRVKLARCGHAC